MTRKIIVKNRVSLYSFKPEEIQGVKVIRITHKLEADFHNPSNKSEPLFWKRTICGGEDSYIDIPESLKGISPPIDAERIYSFKELLIDGKRRSFKKSIRYDGPDKIAMHIACNITAKPKTTYHVSTLEEGLYEYDDYIEEDLRSPLQRAVIIVEKLRNPENLQFRVNTFGEKATAKILENSSRVYCVEILDATGFSIRWRKAGILHSIGQKIPFARTRIIACVTFAFLMAFTALAVAQRNIAFLPMVPFIIIVAFLALIFAFSPQYVREIINALKEISQARAK